MSRGTPVVLASEAAELAIKYRKAEDDLARVERNKNVLIGALRSIIERVDASASMSGLGLQEALGNIKATSVIGLMHIGEEWPGKNAG